MNSGIINYGIIHSLGMTLLHSLWQILAIYIILRIVLSLLKSSDSRAKYNISAISMLVVFLLSIITFSIYQGMENNNESLIFYHLTKISELGPNEVISYPIPLANELQISPEKTVLDYIHWFVLAYFTGIIFLSFRLILGLVYLKRFKNQGFVKLNEDLENIFSNLIGRIKIKRTVSLIESVLTKVPFVLGYFKPVVIVPVGIFNNLPFNQVEAILAHELAHIKRNDFLINIIQSIVELLFFYHPAIYLISRYVRDERENCCDDIALEYCSDSTQYVKALANMASLKMNIAYPAVAFVKKKSNLLERVTRILKPNLMKTKLSDRIFAGLIVIAGLSTILLTGAAALNNLSIEELSNTGTEDASININNLYASNQIASDSIIEFDDGKIITHIKNKKGKKEEIEMTFDKGQLTELLVNGKTIPEKDHHLYKDVVKSTLVDVKEAQKDMAEAKAELANFDSEEVRREVEEAMEELEGIDHDQIMREVEEAMAEAKAEIAEIDFDEIRAEIAEAMEEIDIEEIRMEIKEALEEIDHADIKHKIDSVMNSINWEDIEVDIQRELEESQMTEEELREAMENAMVEIEAIDWDIIGESIELGMDAAAISLDGLGEIIESSVGIGLSVAEEVLMNLDVTILHALESIDMENIHLEMEEAQRELEREGKELDTLQKDMEKALEELEKK